MGSRPNAYLWWGTAPCNELVEGFNDLDYQEREAREREIEDKLNAVGLRLVRLLLCDGEDHIAVGVVGTYHRADWDGPVGPMVLPNRTEADWEVTFNMVVKDLGLCCRAAPLGWYMIAGFH